MTDLRLILFIVIIIIFCFSLISVFFSVTRRVNNKRRYEKLDRLREKFRPVISIIITSGSIGSIHQFIDKSKIRRGSLEWRALEDILFELSEKEGQKNYARKLFDKFGYTQYYHNQLSLRGSSIKLASAAEKLGRIGDPSSIEPLANLLNYKKSEVATVAFRALCRIGTNNALHHVLILLPTLLKEGRITVKTIQTSMLLFGSWANSVLLQYGRRTDNAEMLAVILETLITLPVGRDITEFAFAMLSHPDPEVRAKALKVVAQGEITDFLYDEKVFRSLLYDQVWFVRLQTAKTIGKVKCKNFIDMLKILALDERWQVRDAATLSLVELGDASLDAFLELLETPDRYARESISEEIQRSGFVLNLIEYLVDPNLERKAKAKRILTSMHSMGFSTPLREAVQSGISHPDIVTDLNNILFTGAAA